MACGTDWRLKTVAANGQPGFAALQRGGFGDSIADSSVIISPAQRISSP